MIRLFYLLKFLFNHTNNLLDVLSKPNIKHIHDKVEYEITHMRYKTLLTTQLILFILFILDMIVNRLSLSTSFIRFISCIVTSGILILSCRYSPLIFKIFYNVFCIFYGPFIANLGEAGIHRAWLVSQIFPLFFFVFIGDLKLFLFQTFVQMAYINKLYAPIMERAITFMSPEAYMKSLTYSTNLILFFYIIVVSLAQYYMDHAYKRIAVVEKKKDEIENQKTFLLGFSHELRNLINSLTGNVKLASLEIAASKAKELLLNAEVCGELLLHLVNNILDTGKVEIGELEINPTSTRIYEALERMWGICSELIKRKNLGGKIKISKLIPKNIIIDNYRLTQIFLNLVGNSVKFTETGSVDIHVEWLSNRETVNESCFRPYPFNYMDDHDEGLFEKEKAMSNLDKNSLTLGLTSHKVNSHLLRDTVTDTKRGVLKITVSDTGIGMSEEETKKLFQKFTQVTSDASKRKLGTGLGLFITRELSQRMKGDIRAFSRKGYGSSFIICVPADVVQEESDPQAQDIESLREFIRNKKLKAMIVDDAPFNHAVLRNFFDKLGIEVVDIANNGLEAVQKYSTLLEKGEYLDIMTMDIDMPIMDGKEAARNIRRIEFEKGVRQCYMPIISGNCSESEIAECLDKCGGIKADRFLKKPTTLDELLRAIGHYFVSLQIKKKDS